MIRPWPLALPIRKCLSSRGSGSFLTWYQNRALVMSLSAVNEFTGKIQTLPSQSLWCQGYSVRTMTLTWGQLHKVIHVNELTTAFELYSVLVVYFPIFVINKKVKTLGVSVQNPMKGWCFRMPSGTAQPVLIHTYGQMSHKYANYGHCRRKYRARIPSKSNALHEELKFSYLSVFHRVMQRTTWLGL